jgi:Na+-driven multidrug efflux pump
MDDLAEPLSPEDKAEPAPEPVDKDQSNDAEHFRLGGRPPLKTIGVLAVGPLVSQIVSAMYGIITSMWMASAMGDLGIASISIYSNLDNSGRAFGFFMNCAASSRISALIGEGHGAEAAQLISDLVRCCFVFGLIVPAIFIPSCKPLAVWFGADGETIYYGGLYLIPLLSCSPITCLYLLLCGCLQGEGRSILVGAVQIGSLVSNFALFNPLFLLVFKWKTVGAALATILAELIPSVVLLVLYYRHVFGVKPEVSGLLKKFSAYTLPALRVGVSQLFMNLSRCIPSILLRKFMGSCVQNADQGDTFDDVMAGFNGVVRIFGIPDGVRLAISMGLLPALSYAVSSRNVSRAFWLIFHACWMNLAWAAPVSCVAAFAARQLAMAISKSERYLKWAEPMLKICNWETPFAWIRNVIQTVLQGLDYGLTATLYSFGATFVSYLAIACILFYTNDKDFLRVLWVIPIHGAFAVLVGIVIIYFPLKKLWDAREQLPVEGAGKDVVGDAALELAELDESGKRPVDVEEEVAAEQTP